MKGGIGLFLLLPLVAAAGAAPAEETAGGVAVRETCEGRPKGSACWMGLADRPECYLWNPNLQPGETATWTGECSGRLAHGTGTIAWVWDGGREISESTGRLEDGKRHGTWVERSANGDVREGPYVEGKRHGGWVLRYKSGRVDEGSVVDGKQHGQWVWRWSSQRDQPRQVLYWYGENVGSTAEDDQVMEGRLVKGKQHGKWVIRQANGAVWEGTYVEGEMHGNWVFRDADGDVSGGPYVEGEKHGHWVEQGKLFWNENSFYPGLWKGPYVEGKKHGEWVFRYEAESDQSWLSAQGAFVEGKKHGEWVRVEWDEVRNSRSEERGPFVADKKHGHWIESAQSPSSEFSDYEGSRREGPYVDGKKHGEWVRYD